MILSKPKWTVVQNPWDVTKNLPAKARTAINLSVIIGNLMSFTRSTFVGTYAAWLLAGGQELVNMEHLVAGIGVFMVALFVGDRNLFASGFVIKELVLRSIFIFGEIVPLFFDATRASVLVITIIAALYPLFNGYRAERNNVVWGRNPDALKNKQSFALRLHPLEMAIVALGGVTGMLLIPSVKAMVIGFVATHLVIMVLDIVQNRLVETVRVETGYNEEESE